MQALCINQITLSLIKFVETTGREVLGDSFRWTAAKRVNQLVIDPNLSNEVTKLQCSLKTNQYL